MALHDPLSGDTKLPVDPTDEWLAYLQPEGLTVSANVLREQGLTPTRQTALDSEVAATALEVAEDRGAIDDQDFVLTDPLSLFRDILRWPLDKIAGTPDGPDLPDGVDAPLPEHNTVLRPHYAVPWPKDVETEVPAQILVLHHPTLNPGDKQPWAGDWNGTLHDGLIRLIRDTGIEAGVLICKGKLRLAFAPQGQTPGWIDWPLAALARTEGRPMLAGLKLVMGRAALFTGPEKERLISLLKQSRDAQDRVSEQLSQQVLAALHMLMRGLYAADPERIGDHAERQPHKLYEGLLTALMRLVFLLYAEDRDLLPTAATTEAKRVYESGYSVKTLYQRLSNDLALNPDTMAERRGGWGQLLALFRMVHGGHDYFISARGGKLFDPNRFPFLEGRDEQADEPQVLKVSDLTVWEILHQLMTVSEGRGANAIRARLSYKALEVQQIGSVYETVMGFTAMRAGARMIALKDEKKLPTFIDVDQLLAASSSKRTKWLKDRAISPSTKQKKEIAAASDEAALLEAFGTLVDRRASPDATPIPAGTPYLQPTDERRRSGSHYTPRSLTQPIVRHALEPAFSRIGTNATPDEVLALKICDPACGSGAFLVEACEQLGSRLQQAWERHPGLAPKADEIADDDPALYARRLIAQRSIYGVDRNPMAVDLARLSLWLATLAREHEFTFLDHALKAGDSLVGLTNAQIAAMNWDTKKPGLGMFRGVMQERLNEVHDLGAQIRSAPDTVHRAVQEVRFHRAERKLEPLRDAGDSVIAAFFGESKPKEREAARQKAEQALVGGDRPDWDSLHQRAEAFRHEAGWSPFHWELEFEDVFARERPGFDAMIGNPPFAGKNTISAADGARYLVWLKQLHKGAHGNADLCAHFFRRAFNLLREDGAFGLIATNTICQGDTRQTGLAATLKGGGNIYRALRRYRWPGEAAVVVSQVHAKKGVVSQRLLDGRKVKNISSYLVDSDYNATPEQLAANAETVFEGTKVYGGGFIFSDEKPFSDLNTISKMKQLIIADSRNSNVIKPYLGGDDLNNDVRHSHSRYVIDLGTLTLEEASKQYPDIIDLLEETVKPSRDIVKRQATREDWWQFEEARPGLYAAIRPLNHALFTCKVAPHLSIARRSASGVFAHSLAVFAYETFSPFAVLQSRVHEIWARFFSSTLEDRLRYAPSDCFETFTFPPNYEADVALEAAGQAYHDHRAKLMVETDLGMTKTYNRFHDPKRKDADLAELRRLHHEMDVGVLRAYGWKDLADEARPKHLWAPPKMKKGEEPPSPPPGEEDDHTYQGRLFWPSAFRDEVLARLLKLNGRRHAEEKAAATGALELDL